MKKALAWMLIAALTVTNLTTLNVHAQEVVPQIEQIDEANREETEEDTNNEVVPEKEEEKPESSDNDKEEEPDLIESDLTESDNINQNEAEKLSENDEQEIPKSEEERTVIQVSQDDVLNYLYIDYPEITKENRQNIVVSVGEESKIIEHAVLTLETQQGELFLDASRYAGNAALFEAELSDGVGVFQIKSMKYEIDGNTYELSLEEDEMDSIESTVGEETAGSDQLQMEAEVVSFDAEGNVVSQGSIEEAIAEAKSDMLDASSGISMFAAPSEVSNAPSDVVVVLDPGHDATHGGTSGYDLQEADLNLKIAQYCKAELETYQGVKVYLTRTGKSCPYPGTSSATCNSNRVSYAKSVSADVYISIHIDSVPGNTGVNGAKVFYPNKNYIEWIGREGEDLASRVQKQLVALGLNDRKIGTQDSKDYKYDDGSTADLYQVIRESKKAGFPGIIIEHALLTNSGDVSKFLSSESGLQKLGIADAKGIAEYFNLSKFSFTRSELNASSVKAGDSISLKYALSSAATVRVDVYNGDNSFLKNLVKDKKVGTEIQSISWDLTGKDAKLVYDGTYRLTVTAVNADGTKIMVHKWFTVTGNPRLDFKWVKLGADTVKVGNSSRLYYAVTKNATVTVKIYDGQNHFVRTLMLNEPVKTNDRVAEWDLTDVSGEFVFSGTYRYTITAVDEEGTKVETHRWFQVTGNDPLDFKWVTLGSGTVKWGDKAHLYYAVNKNAKVTVKVYDGNNLFVRTLALDQEVATNDRVAIWDLKDKYGEYVENGTYRYTITAVDEKGTKVETHRWFQVTGRDPFGFKWVTLGSGTVKVGEKANLYYAVNRNAKVTVKIYNEDNSHLKTLILDQDITTSDRMVTWDLTDQSGEYVESGTYRYTVTAEDAKGTSIIAHRWLKVTGNDPLAFKWTTLSNTNVAGGSSIRLYYATNKNASVTIQMYYGNNQFMKTLVLNKPITTTDQVIEWDLKDAGGAEVEPGLYRFTITAVDQKNHKVMEHKYFRVSNHAIMGKSNTTIDQMVRYYNSYAEYPAYYLDSDAPTIETFCRMYFEECASEGVKAEVAFCQAMLETGFLQFGGSVDISQYNFAGLGATGNGVQGEVFPDVRTGIRAQVQHLKAYASTEPLKNVCVDKRYVWVKKGSAPYVEWLGINENPSGTGWATAVNYGYRILKFMSNLATY